MNQQKSKILSLHNVGVFYRRAKGFFSHEKYWALTDISFNLNRGETLGIVGKNGVGKSTLLRLLAGIISPNTGQIIIHNKEIKISLISLQAGFLPSLTGRENTILSGMLLGETKKKMEYRMEDIITFSELGEFFEQPVSAYSTGMRARLGFSIAYHVEPDVILLDEVLGVGDEEFRIKSTEAMKKRIHSDKTVVLVSHSVPLLREVCNRLVWVEGGKSKAQGDVNTVLEQYFLSMKKIDIERSKNLLY
jgi:lipopolysaccharide transport system ATP-binding protein